MDGAELVQRAHQVDPGLPVLVMTAFTTDATLARASDDGVLAVFPKPVPMLEMLGGLERARRGRARLAERSGSRAKRRVRERAGASGFWVVEPRTAAQAARFAHRPPLASADPRSARREWRAGRRRPSGGAPDELGEGNEDGEWLRALQRLHARRTSA